ncbi:MAG: ABC-type multidrug transport system fused ATPase/permease subunit, partial [Limisphaerales bacterium]
YRLQAAMNVVFNILYAIFSLFSLLMVIPFLQVLFGTVKVPASRPDFSWSASQMVELFNFEFGHYIQDKGQVQGLVLICILVIIVFFLKNLCRYMALWFLAPLRNGVVRDLRRNVFHSVIDLPVSYFSEKRKGDVISRMTTDISEVEWAIMNTLEAAVREPLMMIFFLIAMVAISPMLTGFVLILLPITGFIIGSIGKSLKKPSSQAQDRVGWIISLIEESISGLRIVKAFNAEHFQKQRFEEVIQTHYNLQNKVLHRRQLSSPLSEFLGIVVVCAVLWFGGQLVIKGEFQAEVFIGYIIIFANLINPAKAFANAYYYIQRGIASMERIESLLDSQGDIIDPVSPRTLAGFEKAIEYQNVQFSYNNETVVLNDIDLKIEKGKMVAIVGQSGSGKSTLVDLLPRFYDVTDGEIKIDGVNIKEYTRKDLRDLLGIVTQDNILFNDSVRRNITFGNETVNQSQVEEAAKIANAHDFIMQMPDGYDTVIGDRGMKLSGGERQRLTIARAIIANPPILILDEATSSLDSESEKLVQEALYKLMRNRTSIVIAHRLSTIQYADEILVIKNGKILERGNHLSLMARNGEYQRLVEMQAF